MKYFFHSLKSKRFILIGLIISVGFGCASLPKQEYDEAKIWKEKIEYYNLKKLSRKNYESALSTYREAEALYNKNNGKSKKYFQKATLSFKKLYEQTMPGLLNEKSQEMQRLLDIDQRKDLQKELMLLNQYLLAKKVYEAGKLALANKKYEEAFSQMDKSKAILNLLLDTYQLKRETEDWKKKIESFSFVSSLKGEYEAAVVKYKAAEKNYDKENSTARQYFDEAISAFKSIYNITLPKVIEKSINEFELLLAKARELKAHINAKKDYEAAVKQYESARHNLDKKIFDNAVKDIAKASELLNAIMTKLKTKKN